MYSYTEYHEFTEISKVEDLVKGSHGIVKLFSIEITALTIADPQKLYHRLN